MATKTPISILQELMARKNASLPKYTMVSKSNVPCPDRFECVVECENIRATGAAGNKKDAKQESARNALLQIGYDFEESHKLTYAKTDDLSKGLKESVITVNYVGKLNETVTSNNWYGYPEYNFDTDLQTGRYKVLCQIVGLSIAVTGYGINKKEAKQHAAKLMLERLASDDAKELLLKNGKKRSEFLIKNFEEVTEMFTKLSVTNSPLGKPHNESKYELEAIPFIEDDETTEDLEDVLKMNNIKYSLKLLRRNPYLMMLLVDGTIVTHLGIGDNREDATHNALKQAVFMLRNGCSMSVDLSC